MGKKCAFLQCSAGRWPKLCQPDNHLSLLSMKTAFVLRFHKERVSSWIELIESDSFGGEKFDFKVKFRKE